MALVLLAAAVAYIAFWFFIARLLPNWWARCFAVLVALAIPFGDIPIGYLRFSNACAADGGLRVLEQFPPQSSLYLGAETGYTPQDLFRRGFAVAEFLRMDGRIDVYARDTKETRFPTRTNEAKSKILLAIDRNQHIGWGITRHDRSARLHPAGRTVARFTRFRWAGGWLREFAAPALGFGGECFSDPTDPLLTLLAAGTR